MIVALGSHLFFFYLLLYIGSTIPIMKESLIFLLAILLLPPSNAQEFEVLFDSDEEGVSCYRIPAIAQAVNGDLIVAVDERIPSCADLRGSDDINIVIKRSTDNGKTWMGKEKVVDFPTGNSASDPAFVVDEETEEIFLFYNCMDLVKEPNVYYFQYVKSSDHGATWSEPIDITSQISPPESRKDFQFITSGRGIQTKDGKLLHTLVSVSKGVFIFGSDDHGKSWKQYGNLISPGDESKLVELSDGSWLVNSRVRDAGHRWIHTSTDQGNTWQSKSDSTLVDPACNASLIDYGDNVLYFSNIDHENKRANLVLRKSEDAGQTWVKKTTIYNGPAAYSTMTKLRNGDLGIVFEKDEYKQIVFYYFAIE